MGQQTVMQTLGFYRAIKEKENSFHTIRRNPEDTVLSEIT